MTIGALPPAGPGAPATGRPAPAGDAASRAAASFERVLLEQLTTQLAATAAPGDDEASAATSAYRDLLPRAMADSLAAAGGIGIAAALAPAPGAAADGTPPASPGVPSPTGSPS